MWSDRLCMESILCTVFPSLWENLVAREHCCKLINSLVAFTISFCEGIDKKRQLFVNAQRPVWHRLHCRPCNLHCVHMPPIYWIVAISLLKFIFWSEFNFGRLFLRIIIDLVLASLWSYVSSCCVCHVLFVLLSLCLFFASATCLSNQLCFAY